MSEPSTAPRTTNDAVRLRAILIQAKDAGIPENENLFIGWAQVFDIQDPSSEGAISEIVSRVGEVRRLNMEVLSQLETIKTISPSLYSEPLLQLGKVLTHQKWTNTRWALMSGVLSPINMRSLEYIVDAFDRESRLQEQVIPPDELKEISQQIFDLYEAVRQSKLQKGLRTVLLEMLDQMKQGIHEYHIGGLKRLKQHLGKTYATWLVYQDEIKPEEKKDGIVTKVLNLATKIVTVADSASKSVSLLGTVIKGYLGPGS